MDRARAAGHGRGAAAAAAVIGGLTLAGYVAILVAEGDSPFRLPPLVFVMGIAGATAGATAGAVRRPAAGGGRTPALVVSAVLFGAAGLLGIFSIGLPLVVAAALCAVAAGRDPRGGRPEPHRPRDEPAR